eukprot:COSAG01_NODE_26720_length_705_cov_0.848185_1_plen_218_part_00
MVSLGLLLLLLQSSSSSSAAKVRVNPNTHAFTQVSGRDTSGRDIVRELYFHGVNYVRKGSPYIADSVDCGPPWTGGPPCPPPQKWTLTGDDVLELEQRGMNVVRLGVMWPGAMPEAPGKLNASYFDQVERIVDLLWKREIYTIIDLHQDVLSPRICGEGAPLWVQTTREALGGAAVSVATRAQAPGHTPRWAAELLSCPDPDRLVQLLSLGHVRPSV